MKSTAKGYTGSWKIAMKAVVFIKLSPNKRKALKKAKKDASC
jgi:hypothetical protein